MNCREFKGIKVSNNMDLHLGNQQIKMREEYTPNATFRTHEVNYEFSVINFKITNVPSTF